MIPQEEPDGIQGADDQPVFLIKDGQFNQIAGHPIEDIISFSGLLSHIGAKKLFVVSGIRFQSYPAYSWIESYCKEYTHFSGFEPNPTYEQVLAGVQLFRETNCDCLVSVGGGSAIDVAKCIQAFASMKGDGNQDCYADRPIDVSVVPHIALPTTAGTGSESTHFAVVYVNGEKRSIADRKLVPTAAVLDPSVLEGLSYYQKRATVLDALCQAIESYWSVRSCEESRAFSALAIPVILEHAEDYLSGDFESASLIMIAANQAGKAINITTTTAPHALSYKLTSLYGIAHGHAVALCMPELWRLLIEKGNRKVQERLVGIAQLMGAETPLAAWERFVALIDRLFSDFPVSIADKDTPLLVRSVNAQRLTNFPVDLTLSDIEHVYRSIR